MSDSERETLENHLYANPGDDNTWKVYADWLIDHSGDINSVLRGEFIQLQLQWESLGEIPEVPKRKGTTPWQRQVVQQVADRAIAERSRVLERLRYLRRTVFHHWIAPFSPQQVLAPLGFVTRIEFSWRSHKDKAPWLVQLNKFQAHPTNSRFLHAIRIKGDGGVRRLQNLVEADFSRIEALEIRRIPGGTPLGLLLAKKEMPKLRALIIDSCDLTNDGIGAIMEEAEWAKQLQAIHLPANLQTEEFWATDVRRFFGDRLQEIHIE